MIIQNEFPVGAMRRVHELHPSRFDTLLNKVLCTHEIKNNSLLKPFKHFSL
jgi:hypothetical protein